MPQKEKEILQEDFLKFPLGLGFVQKLNFCEKKFDFF